MVVHPTLYIFSVIWSKKVKSVFKLWPYNGARFIENVSKCFLYLRFKFIQVWDSDLLQTLGKKPHGVMPEYPRVHRDRSKALGWLHQWLPSSQTYSNAKEHHHWILSMEEELWLTKVWNRHCTLIIKSIYLKPFNTLSLRFYL